MFHMKADPTNLILLWQTKPSEKDIFCGRLFCPAEPGDKWNRIAKIEANAGESDKVSANDSQSPSVCSVQTLQMLKMLPLGHQADNVHVVMAADAQEGAGEEQRGAWGVGDALRWYMAHVHAPMLRRPLVQV